MAYDRVVVHSGRSIHRVHIYNHVLHHSPHSTLRSPTAHTSKYSSCFICSTTIMAHPARHTTLSTSHTMDVDAPADRMRHLEHPPQASISSDAMNMRAPTEEVIVRTHDGEQVQPQPSTSQANHGGLPSSVQPMNNIGCVSTQMFGGGYASIIMGIENYISIPAYLQNMREKILNNIKSRIGDSRSVKIQFVFSVFQTKVGAD